MTPTSKEEKPKLWSVTEKPKLKTSEILEQMKALFPVCASRDFKDFDEDFPAPDKATTRYFKATVEADPELAYKSADDLKKEGIAGITLRERLLLELQHFKETGGHLDVENVTLCAGSRSARGSVPSVHCSGGRVRVEAGWCGPSHADGDLRSRAAVSLESSSLSPQEEKIENLERHYKTLNDLIGNGYVLHHNWMHETNDGREVCTRCLVRRMGPPVDSRGEYKRDTSTINDFCSPSMLLQVECEKWEREVEKRAEYFGSEMRQRGMKLERLRLQKELVKALRAWDAIPGDRKSIISYAIELVKKVCHGKQG